MISNSIWTQVWSVVNVTRKQLDTCSVFLLSLYFPTNTNTSKITIFLCKHTPPPNVSFLTNQLYWKCFIETAALGINREKHNTPLPVPRTMWLSWPPQIVSQMTPYSIYSALLPTRSHRALLKSPVALYIGIRCHLARTLASWGKIKTT